MFMPNDTSRLETLHTTLRPALHRYCARMVGSVVDGEDIVQEAMLKAHLAWESIDKIDNPEGWLFRIAHNAALDFIRRRLRMPELLTEEELAMIAGPVAPDPDLAEMSIRTFLRLPSLQRSAVILKDVLGHTIEEISTEIGVSEAAAKSALQRGRARLRELAAEHEDTAKPVLSHATRRRLFVYVESFRIGDFDTVRAMLAEDVKLDLVGKFQRQGKSKVSDYYGAYAAARRWAFRAGIVDGRPAMLVYDREVSLDQVAYFVVLTFADDKVLSIHDFLYARYALEAVSIEELGDESNLIVLTADGHSG
jgi:RNA polymerase sigma-70 factor (ECF subfamily)